MKSERKRLGQSIFVRKISLLIQYVYERGYELTFGDTWSKPEYKQHKPDSFHYKRVAIDLNLFKDGNWLTETEDHKEFGEFWERLGGSWGGRWGDGNHYSWGEGR